MKGLILSGGSGTRMRPLTHSIAKQLLPVANKPILHRALQQMSNIGIREVAIVVGATADQVRNSVGDGSQFNLLVTYIKQDQPLGLAHCVKIARGFLGDDDFIMFLGDNMFEDELVSIANNFDAQKNDPGFAAQVSVKRVMNPSDFGVATVDHEFQLISVEEKPKSPKSNLALVGTYCFSSRIHTAIDEIEPSPRGELEITDAIQKLLNSGLRVGVSEVSGWWFDTGNPESYLECNSRLLDAEETSAINLNPDVKIIRPCSIDSTARLFNCTIGPYVSIGAGVQIDGATFQNSVLLENSWITGPVNIQNSILGKQSGIRTEKASDIRIILGDDCYVELGTQ
jgi:glucose-1-phosphate thymidylyltransferase